MIAVTNVEDTYKYVADRANFEILRASQNAAFMLNQHLNDSDVSYLKSDTYKRLQNRAEEAKLQQVSYLIGVIYCILNNGDDDYKVPDTWEFKDENHELVYQI